MLENTTVVLLNGPPRSGKDTAAEAIMAAPFLDMTKRFERFSMPLKAFWCAAYGYPMDARGNSDLEHIKEKKLPPFDESYREGQIFLSENYVKEDYGDLAFGELMATRIGHYRKNTSSSNHLLVVIPDSGFASEAVPVVDLVGASNVLLALTIREGRTFSGDSRSYISLPGVHTESLVNEGDIKSYKQRAVNLVKDFLRDRINNKSR